MVTTGLSIVATHASLHRDRTGPVDPQDGVPDYAPFPGRAGLESMSTARASLCLETWRCREEMWPWLRVDSAFVPLPARPDLGVA